MSQRLVERAARFLGAHTSRRSFLQRTALVSTAVAVVGKDYLLRPGTAYAALCACAGQGCACGSLCCDGYTEFCCTITGSNVCPPGTIAGGWWKADGSRYCNGPRYYIDCNATCRCGSGHICPDNCSNAPWGCGCAGHDCGNRKAGCTAFRYGQCNQQVPIVGRIACRVVSCDPAVLVTGNCAPTLAVDNSTANHNKPCLQAPPPQPAQRGKKKMQFIVSDATGDLWFVTDGIHRRALAPGEANLLVDLGLVIPERDANGNIRPKWVSSTALARIPFAK